MIYELIKQALSSVDPLGNRVYPVYANIDGKDGATAIYSFGQTVPFRGLSGRVHHYTQTASIQILTDDFDAGQEIYFQAEQALLELPGMEDSSGNRVLRVNVQSVEPDAFALEIAKNIRALQAEILWAPA